MDRTLGMRFTIIAPLRTGQDDSGRLEGGALTNSRPWRPIPGRRGGSGGPHATGLCDVLFAGPVGRGGHAGVLLEVAAEEGLVREVQVVGDLLDVHRRVFQQILRL